MRYAILMIALIVMISPAACFAGESKQAPGQVVSSSQAQDLQKVDEKAVRASAEAFVAAFNKGDAKGIAALWTTDCEYSDETGRVLQGRNAIEKQYAELFATNPGLKMDTNTLSVKIVGENSAVEEGTSIMKSADGALLSKASYTAALLRDGDKWLMASVREHASPALSVRPNFQSLEWLIGDWTAQKDSKSVDFNLRWVADKKFIELSYAVRDKGIPARSGIQIIGRDPVSGDVISWSFDSNGGYGKGHWRLLKKGLIIESQGMLADGAPTASTDIISRIDGESLGWQSVNRTVSGKNINDSETVVLKRKPR